MTRTNFLRFVCLLLPLVPIFRQQTYAQGSVKFDWVTTGVIDSNAPSTVGSGVMRDIAVDNSGAIYTVGDVGQRMNWGGFPLKPNIINAAGELGTSSFISKSDAQGNIIWTENFADSLGNVTSWGSAIATDNQGHIYVGIRFQGSINIGTSRFVTIYNTGSASSEDALLLKMDTSGQVIWTRQIWTSRWRTGTQQTRVNINEISIDDQGNVYIVGEGAGVIAIDTNYISAPYFQDAGFMAKYDPNGNCLWANGVFGKVANSYPTGTSIKPDNNGGVYIHGGYKDSIVIDNTVQTGSTRSAYFAKLNAENGRLVWIKAIGKEPAYIDWFGFIGTTSPLTEGKMTYDGLGHLIINGTFFAGKMDFDPGDNPADTFYLRRSSTDTATTMMAEGAGFVLKVDTAGKFIWAKALQSVRGGGMSGHSNLNPITTDQFGYIYTASAIVSGSGVGDTDPVGIDFDPGPDTFMVYSAKHRPVSYIVRLDPEGNFRYVRTFGATIANTLTHMVYGVPLTSLAIPTDGQTIYTAGNFTAGAIIDFDPGPDSFIVHMPYAALNTNSPFLHKISCTVDPNGGTIDTATDCNGVTVNGQTFTTEGIHEVVFHNWSGCDSIVNINLTLLLPDPIITVDVDTLSTTKNYKSYQWMLNGELIQGATNRKYTVSKNGNYQVVVTDESGCSDTSDIYEVTNQDETGIDAAKANRLIRIYPNPTSDIVMIESVVTVNVTLTGIDGKILHRENAARQVSMKKLAAGVYFLHVNDDKGNLLRVEKIVKQ